MQFLKNLFGQSDDPESLRLKAEEGLRRAEQAMTIKECAKALAVFEHGPIEAIVDFGGPLHQRLLDALLRLHALAERPVADDELPTLKVYTDPAPSDWPALLAESVSGNHDLVYIRETAPFNGHRVSLCAMDMWIQFAWDPALAAAYIGEGYLMIRRGMLKHLTEQYPDWAADEPNCEKTAELLSETVEFAEGEHEYTLTRFEVFCHRAKA